MAVQNLKYCEYFDVNEKYFPCIDESAINSGASWDDTYPHTTFIDLLNLTEKMLGGNTNRSIWIHGAYGTGKSKCAYTLKKSLKFLKMKSRHTGTNSSRLKRIPPFWPSFLDIRLKGSSRHIVTLQGALLHLSSFSLRFKKVSRRLWTRMKSHTKANSP